MSLKTSDGTDLGIGAIADGQTLKRVGANVVGYTPAGGSEAFPVGSVFTAMVSTNPAVLLGYGTWASRGTGRVLVGVDPADPAIDAPGKTTGAKTVPSAGTVGAIGAPTGTAQKIGTSTASAAASTHGHAAPTFTGSPTSVVQPSLAVYFWERTA